MLTLDLDQFDDLYGSLRRNEALEKTEQAWMHTTAAAVGMTGNTQLMKDFTARWFQELGQQQQNDQAKLAKKVGKGLRLGKAAKRG